MLNFPFCICCISFPDQVLNFALLAGLPYIQPGGQKCCTACGKFFDVLFFLFKEEHTSELQSVLSQRQ